MLTATDRLMALADGQVLAIGPPHDVIQLPQVKRVYLGV
jgi:ABC-type branched-subunit amino acid transport system ATPase component